MWNQLSSAATALVPTLQEQQCSQSEPTSKNVYQQQDLAEEHVQWLEDHGYSPENMPEWIVQAEFHSQPNTQ